MTKTISVKIDDETWRAMRLHEDINWSGVLRQNIRQRLGQKEAEQGGPPNKEHAPINQELALKAFEDALDISKHITGRKSEDIIREWRDKRK